MKTAKQEAHRLREKLRLAIYLSELSHRDVEERAGFSRGYLSRVLYGGVELKYRHVITIVDAMDLSPAELFADLYPRRRNRALESLEGLQRHPRLGDQPLVFQLTQLFGVGIEALMDLCERLERCEEALTELGELGLLDLSSIWAEG